MSKKMNSETLKMNYVHDFYLKKSRQINTIYLYFYFNPHLNRVVSSGFLFCRKSLITFTKLHTVVALEAVQ